MKKPRTQHGSRFKAKVAVESLRSDSTLCELSRKHKIHSNQISKWRKQLVDGAFALFEQGARKPEVRDDELISELYQKIGQLEVELDWLKKKSGLDRR